MQKLKQYRLASRSLQMTLKKIKDTCTSVIWQLWSGRRLRAELKTKGTVFLSDKDQKRVYFFSTASLWEQSECYILMKASGVHVMWKSVQL